MKKGILLLAVFGVFTLSSCEKDYTCTCTVSGPGFPTTSTSATITGKKKDAEAACNNGNASYFGVTTTCKLD